MFWTVVTAALLFIVARSILGLIRSFGDTQRINPQNSVGSFRDGAGNVMGILILILVGCLLYVGFAGGPGVLRRLYDPAPKLTFNFERF
ncbi:MAG TPA: hypothetical protein P5081_01750 [Phycisphaerae bacterium]|nr:hypothetical protein [Phycisphaerae bacterium]